MRNGTVHPIPPGVTEEITSCLAEWRSTHKPPTPLPQEIWTRAIDLAVQYGVRPTAHALGLGYASLLKRVKPSRAKSSAQNPAFMEWLPAVSNTIPECVLEVEAGSGGHLRVQMKNVSASGVGTIVREFCR